MSDFGRKDDKEKKADQGTKGKSPDFSNVRSGGSSTAPSAPTGKPSDTTGARTYVVVKGDSLSKIAKQEYGDANKWRAIYEANKDIIKDPDLIYPGQTLRLP